MLTYIFCEKLNSIKIEILIKMYYPMGVRKLS